MVTDAQKVGRRMEIPQKISDAVEMARIKQIIKIVLAMWLDYCNILALIQENLHICQHYVLHEGTQKLP